MLVVVVCCVLSCDTYVYYCGLVSVVVVCWCGMLCVVCCLLFVVRSLIFAKDACGLDVFLLFGGSSRLLFIVAC